MSVQNPEPDNEGNFEKIQFRWDNIVIEKPCALSGHEVVGS